MKRGWPRLSPWHDLAPHRIVLLVIGSIVLITATVVWDRLRGADNGIFRPMYPAFPPAIANGVLVVAYFGLAAPFFLFRFGRRGSSYLALFLFLAWIVPLTFGFSSLLTGVRRRVQRNVLASAARPNQPAETRRQVQAVP